MSRASPAAGGGGDRRLVLLLVATISVFWGFNWPAMKVGVGELGPWLFRTITVGVAGACLLAAARLGGERIRLAVADLRSLLPVSLFAVTGWHLFTAFGLTYIGGGRAVIVAFTMPLWAAITSSLWLGERHGARLIAALFLGLVGIGVLMGPDIGRLVDQTTGSLLVLGASICWAIGTVGTKARRWSVGATALAGWQLLLGWVPILLATLLFDPLPDLSGLTLRGILATAYASTVALALCYGAFIKIVTMVPASVAAISTLAIPVIGVSSSALLLGEPLGFRELAALALILPALALVLLPRRGG